MAAKSRGGGRKKAAPAPTNSVNLNPTQRAALETRLNDWILSSLADKTTLAPTWQQVRSYYNNVPIQFISRIQKGVQDIAFPFMQHFVDTLNDNVSQAIFNQDPILSISQPGPRALTRANEKVVQFFFERGQLEECLKAGQEDVALTNEGVIRLVLKPDEMLFDFEPIMPDDFIVLGSGCYNLLTADLAGHAFYPTIQEVKDRVALKVYDVAAGYEPLVYSGQITENKTDKVNPPEGVDMDQRPTRLFFVSFLCDLKELELGPTSGHKPDRKWYTAHYDLALQKVLLVQHSSMKRHPYFKFSYLARPTRGHWSSRSVGFNLAGLHIGYQISNNMLLYGHLMTAFKPVVSRGPFAKGQNIGPGAMITAMGGEITIPNIDFDPKQLPFIIQNFERQGQATIRISQAGQAQTSAMKKTATQVMEEAEGQAVGRTGYVSTYAVALCEIAREILLYVEALWPEFKAAHGSALPDPPDLSQEEDLTGMPPMPINGGYPFGNVASMDFEVTGSSPSSNPAFQFARGMMLMEMVEKFPELKRTEVIDTIFGGMQLRNASELQYTQKEMEAMRQEQFQQQLALAQAQAPVQGAAPGAGGPAALPAGGGGEPTPEQMQDAFVEGFSGGGDGPR